jgi:hypothetical protein
MSRRREKVSLAGAKVRVTARKSSSARPAPATPQLAAEPAAKVKPLTNASHS